MAKSQSWFQTIKRFELAPTDCSENLFLEVSLEYDSGTPSILGWKGRARGYYLCCHVCERLSQNGTDVPLYRYCRDDFGNSKRKYKLILEVTRHTPGAKKKALALAAETEAELVRQTCEFYALEIKQAPPEKEVA